MIKLCIFDFNSTLVDGETIDILVKAYDREEEVMDITHHVMAGELDFFESLQEHISFLEGMPYDLVLKIEQDLPPMNGAYELIELLNSKNIFVVILSGGPHEGIDPTIKKLRVGLGFADYLHHKNNTLLELMGEEMMFSDSKGLMLQHLKNFLDLQTHEVMRVGDGADDIAMFNESSLKVAFCAKETLRSKADICVGNKGLKKIIKVI